MTETPRSTHVTSRFWAGWGQHIAARPGWTLALAALIGLGAALSAGRLRPLATIEAMLAKGDAAGDALAHLIDGYHGLDELMVMVSLPEGDQGVEGAGRLLAFAERLAAAAIESPALSALCDAVIFAEPPDARRFVEREMIPHALYYVDDETLAAVRARFAPDALADQLRRAVQSLSAPGVGGGAIGRLAGRDPLGLRDFLSGVLPMGAGGAGSAEGAFLSDDQRHLLIRIPGREPVSNLDYAHALTEAVRAKVEEINRDGLTIELTGGYAIAAASQQAIRSDMIRSVTVSVLVLQALFLMVYRHPLCFTVAVAPVGLGILCGFGVFGLFSTHLTPLTAVTGAVLAGLGIDYSIHYLSHYESRRAAGDDPATAVRLALADIAPALASACGTSMVGFLVIAQSRVTALREFAMIGALGLGGALLATLVVLPALLTVWHRWVDGRTLLSAVRVSLGGVARAAAVRPAAWQMVSGVVLVSAVVLAVTRAGGPLHFESDLTVMHPRPNSPLDAQALAAERFGFAPDPMLIVLRGESPEHLVALAHEVDDRLSGEAVRTAGIAGTLGVGRLLPNPRVVERRKEQLAGWDVPAMLTAFDDAVAESPFVPEALKGYREFLGQLLSPGAAPDLYSLRRYPALGERLLPRTAFMEGDAAPAEALTLVLLRDPLADRAARDAAIEATRGALADVPGATLTGLSVLGHDTERLMRQDLRRLLGVAAVIVFFWLMIVFRDLRATVLALLPTLFALIALAGLMAASGTRLNAVNLMAIPLMIGLGVDNGIILVSVSRRERRETDGDRWSLVRLLSPACHALIITAATTLLTFGSLIWTSTPAISSFGSLVGAGIAASLAGSLLLLVPTLLRRGAADAASA